MSDKRAIIVELCAGCPKLENCSALADLELVPEKIPDSCPLPKWPSVDMREIEHLRGSLLTRNWPEKKLALIKFLKSKGMEVRDGED